MPRTSVFAAVIQRNGRYLVCRRPAHKRHGGLWEFPGGKLEAGESCLDAARREMTEELDVRVLGVAEPLLSVQDPGSEFEIVFVPTSIEGEPRCIEHSELKWLTPEELPALDMAPSDRTFVESLLR